VCKLWSLHTSILHALPDFLKSGGIFFCNKKRLRTFLTCDSPIFLFYGYFQLFFFIAIITFYKCHIYFNISLLKNLNKESNLNRFQT